MIRNYWPFALIFLASLALYYPSLNYYFFQDDWFVLNRINISSFGEFLSFFNFKTDIIYYRPVGMFSFFLIAKSLFGLNPFAYHVIAFIMHLVNSLLIGYLSFKIFKNSTAAYISSFMYATAAFHFMTLSWLSLTWNTIGMTFFMLALISYLNFFKFKKQISVTLTLIFFTLALLSSEFALSFALLIILVELFYKSNLNRKYNPRNLGTILLIVIISSIYLALKMLQAPIPKSGEYSPTFDSRVIGNSFWYLVWLLNIPEVVRYNIKLLPLSFSNDRTFLGPFQPFLLPTIGAFLTLTVSSFYLVAKKINIETLKKLTVAVLFLILGLTPVIFLPSHSFPYYLTIPSIGFFLLVAHFLTGIDTNKLSKIDAIFLILFTLSWFSTSFLAISFTAKTHWIPGEQAISKEFVEKIINSHPISENPKSLTITNSNNQIKQSLMDQNAMQVIYNNDNLKTIYK